MKQDMETTRSISSLLATATEDELVVSQVLLDLRVMCSLSESLSKFNWGHRKMRSALDAPLPLSPAPTSRDGVVADVVQVQVEADVARLQVKGGGDDDEAKANTASPDTPLDFPTPPSESDDKQSSHHSSRKRSREKKKCVGMIEELTEQRDVLRGEVEKVKQHYKELKAYNSELKSMKLKVLNSGSPSMEISRGGGANPAVELAQHYQTTIVVVHPRPLIGEGDEAPRSCQFPIAGPQPSNYGLGSSANHVGPLGIDLNVSAEEALGLDPWQPLDPLRASPDERARCAEARRIRSAKIKSMRRRRWSGSGTRLPRTR